MGIVTPFLNVLKCVTFFEPGTLFCRDDKFKAVLKRLYASDLPMPTNIPLQLGSDKAFASTCDIR